MKKIFFFWLCMTVMAQAQISVGNIGTLFVCDANSDGMTCNINLADKTAEVLSLTTPLGNYQVSYHETYNDAFINANALPTSGYCNISPFQQNIYIRVASPTDVGVGHLVVQVVNGPQLNGFLTDYTQVSPGTSGIATFDLTSQTSALTFGNTSTVVQFHTSQADAEANINAIANPSAYTNTTPYVQRIWVRGYDATFGCYSITSFLIRVQGFTISSPSPYVLCDAGNDQNEVFTLSTKNAEILGNLNPMLYGVRYFHTQADAQAYSNPIDDLYTLQGSTETLIARIDEIAAPGQTAYTNVLLKINPYPVVTITGQATACVGESAMLTISAANVSPEVQFSYNENGNIGTITTNQMNWYNVVIPTQNPGTYTYSITQAATTDGAYCAAPQTASISVQIGGLLSATMAVTPDTACAGGTPPTVQFIGSQGTPPYTFYYSINGGAPTTVVSAPGSTMATVALANYPAGTYEVALQQVGSGNCVNQVQSTQVFQLIDGLQAYPVSELTVVDTPFDGFATFNLTAQTATIIGNQTNCTVAYYVTAADAQNQTNPISTPTAFINSTNPQTIYARISATNQQAVCSPITSFGIRALDPSVIYFPDAQLKATLVNANPNNVTAAIGSSFVTIDTNHDGEIQYAEAALIQRLDIYNTSIVNMQGVQYFANLTVLSCTNNQINNLPLTGLTQLRELHAQNNHIAAIDFTGITQLQVIDLTNNLLDQLVVSQKPALTTLHVSNNQLTQMDLTDLPALLELQASSNLLTSWSAFLPLLVQLDLSFNQLSQINLSGVPQLQVLEVASNQLHSLDVSNCSQLNSLNFNANQVASIDLSNLPYLQQFRATTNALTTLDASLNHMLNTLEVSQNPLVTMFLKNGSNEAFDFNNFYNMPNLQYVCVDESQLADYQNYFDQMNINVTLSTYCSMAPGGGYNTISGWVRFDGNGNGCDANDGQQPLIGLQLTDPNNNTAMALTNVQSQYHFYTGAGTFTLTPQWENASWYQINPAQAVINFTDANNHTTTQNFCLTPNGVHPDAEVVVAPMLPAMPGFVTWLRVLYKNKGNQSLSGSVALQYNAAQLDWSSSSTTPSTNNSGQVVWNFTDLLPFENRYIDVFLTVHSPQQTPAVNLGDVLHFSAIIDPSSDENPADNNFAVHETVVGSFDPNAVTCLEGDQLPTAQVGQYLHYLMMFENTGTAAASFITVASPFDTTEYDLSSIQVLNTSHAAEIRIINNRLEVFYPNIQLESGGHGHVLLKVKSNHNLGQGDQVNRKANIYFDYNHPVATNTATTTFTDLNRDIVNRDIAAVVWPNPVHDRLHFKANTDLQGYQLYDVQGRLLRSMALQGLEASDDWSQLPQGIYFVKINTVQGQQVLEVTKK